MVSPKLSTRSSGLGGRGYKQIFEDGSKVPSITTALGAIDKPGLIHWHVEQTVLYAVTHIDQLLSRTEEAGVGYLSYVTRRKPDDWDDEELSPYTAAQYVLDDLSNTGVWIHKFIEDDLNGFITDEPLREDHYEMAEAYLRWKEMVDIEVIATESTVFGSGYAGTGDVFAYINGVPTCIDTKSSRKVHETHIAQLAAVGAGDYRAVEVPEGTEGAVYHKLENAVAAEYGGNADSWWVQETVPDFSQYGILQVRPTDFDRRTGEQIDPFCELHIIPQEQIDAGFELFQASLAVRKASATLDHLIKAREKKEK